MNSDFLHRDVPSLKKRVHRLGLAPTYGIDEAGVAAALERGLNYLFWPMTQKKNVAPVLDALRRDRERLVIATLPTLGGFFGWSVRAAAENALRFFQTDYIDVFQLGWLGRASRWSPGTVEALCQLREEGKVRAIGVSIHDRVRAGQLAKDSPLDLLMIRYNAAHPGAERDVFPHLAHRHPALIAYTATSWRQLLKQPKGWDGPVPTAGDCYRFCLSNPAVDVVLCGPGSAAHLDENLKALAQGPLSAEQMTWMRAIGEAVHRGSHIPGAPA